MAEEPGINPGIELAALGGEPERIESTDGQHWAEVRPGPGFLEGQVLRATLGQLKDGWRENLQTRSAVQLALTKRGIVRWSLSAPVTEGALNVAPATLMEPVCEYLERTWLSQLRGRPETERGKSRSASSRR